MLRLPLPITTVPSRTLATGSLLLALLVAVPGCYGSTSAYVEAPVGVEAYPRTYYGGRVVYLVGDRWYWRDRGAWVYFRTEPPPLYRYRMHYRHYGPARPHYYHRHYHPPADRRAAPPARHRAPPPVRRSAPPSWRRP